MVKLFYSIYRFLSVRRGLAAVALVMLIVIEAILALRMEYEEDIARFLPVDTEQEAYREAVEQMTSQSRIVVVFTGERDSVKQAMERFESHFSEVDTAGVVCDLQVTVDETAMFDMLSFTCENAPYFLLPADYARMDSLLATDGFVASQLSAHGRAG